MNKYVAFFNGKELDIEAATLLQAKEKAVVQFKASKRKAHMVHVHLVELASGSKVVMAIDF